MQALTYLLPLLLAASATAHAELNFSGAALPAIEVKASPSAGLDGGVFVLPYVEGVSVSYAGNGAEISWQRFSAMGAAYSEPVSSTQQGAVSTLSHLEGNMGYAVTDGSSTSYFWIVDYSTAPFEIREIELSDDMSDCGTTRLDIDGSAPPLTYYSITGVPHHIDREIKLEYLTLEFDAESFAYRQTTHVENLEKLDAQIVCPAPLCPTEFTISGDRFSTAWGDPHHTVSDVCPATAVALETQAVQIQHDADNEIREDAALGGSGPVEIEFRAAVSDAAVFHEWEIARDRDFNQVFMRERNLEFTYTFREQGTTYVRMNAANDSGECTAESETYEVFVGESALKCPNAFSPGTSPGVNDEWKVAYKSIVSFDCQIFDRNGRRMAHLTHPSQGWNGRIGSKTVPAGVYFYVIRAEGTDGKKYKLSGDINVIDYNKHSSTSTVD